MLQKYFKFTVRGNSSCIIRAAQGAQQLVLKYWFLCKINGSLKYENFSSIKIIESLRINKFTKITHLIKFYTDCKASYNVETGRQSVSILLQEGLVKLIALH